LRDALGLAPDAIQVRAAGSVTGSPQGESRHEPRRHGPGQGDPRRSGGGRGSTISKRRDHRGVHVFLEALAQLQAHHPSVQAVLIGADTPKVSYGAQRSDELRRPGDWQRHRTSARDDQPRPKRPAGALR